MAAAPLTPLINLGACVKGGVFLFTLEDIWGRPFAGILILFKRGPSLERPKGVSATPVTGLASCLDFVKAAAVSADMLLPSKQRLRLFSDWLALDIFMIHPFLESRALLLCSESLKITA